MADPVAPLHPRKLYTRLRECGSTLARAQAALEFMRTSTTSDAGFLFLPRGGDLILIASAGTIEPTPELLLEAKRTWDRELDRQPDDNKTMELSSVEALRLAHESAVWKSSDGESFERRLLSIYRPSGWTPVGLVLLKSKEIGRSLQPVRQVHIEALCNALLDAGDVQERSIPPQPRHA